MARKRPGKADGIDSVIDQPPTTPTQSPLLVEYDITGHACATYDSQGVRSSVQPSSQHAKHDSAIKARLTQLLSLFLPEGYPDSVSSDYLPFQCWDTVQAVSSYVRGMLTSTALLKGAGMGQAASPLAAVFMFFVRDLAGMLGGILFAVWQGSSFDTCAKQWRLFADVTNDIGMAVELASPFFPRAFLAMACIGSIARAMTGVAGGATRAALTSHFAIRNNAADVSAKESSQETATTLIGMVLGMAFTRMTADHTAAAWLLFILLTWIHIWANIKALRCLVLNSLNTPRLEQLVANYIRMGQICVAGPSIIAASETLVPPPLREFAIDMLQLTRKPLHGYWSLQYRRPLIATSISKTLEAWGFSDISLAMEVEQAKEAKLPYLLLEGRNRVFIILHRDHVNEANMLQAYVHALWLCHPRSHNTVGNIRGTTMMSNTCWVQLVYSDFLKKLQQAGWNTSRIQIKLPQVSVSYDLDDAKES